jgi:hypothetical protein
MRVLAGAVTLFGALQWTAVIINVATLWMPGKGGSVLLVSAAMMWIVATMLWIDVARARRHDASLGLLARTVADTTRPAAERPRHLHLVP